MALKGSVEMASGILIEDSYARIEFFSGSKTTASVDLFFYTNQESVDEKPPVKIETYTFPIVLEDGAANIAKQGYEYLKTLPEFEGFTDV